MILRLLRRSATCTLATSAAATALSGLETGRPAAALNATSHIVWGEAAFDQDEPTLKHTLVGTLLNVGAMVAWSAVYELTPQPRSLVGRLAKSAAVTVAAYVTDYHIVPNRFTPGFEARLSPSALGAVYGALAAGFLAGD
jgi:hypothetical protein